MTDGVLRSHDPRSGSPVGPPVPVTTPEEAAEAVRRAHECAPAWAALTPCDRADVLDRLADAIDGARDELVALADQETALGPGRLAGEVARTSGQLRMFADVLGDGSHLDVVISPRSATGGTDVRRMLFPVGPVAVYAASNFPFAFSVAGGDTASALAAGCPVVVKAHEGHPRTSARTAELLRAALVKAGQPADVLSVVHGFEAGRDLIVHPAITAAGFTGSLEGGRALLQMATSRSEPIPFYGEMGSVNPVVVLPAAARDRAEEIATGYVASLTLGVGQFCTNPGLLFVPHDAGLLAELGRAARNASGGPMLTGRMRDAYVSRSAELSRRLPVRLAAGPTSEEPGGFAAEPVVWQVSLADFAAQREELGKELFGPAGLVVVYDDVEALLPVLEGLEGQLTASVHADAADRAAAGELLGVLRRRAGRLVHNGWPTGVAVCWAMHHGGPWPATTDAAHTSVGARAITRWLVPTAFQDWPDDLLPAELQDANPLRVPRTIQP